MRWYGHAKTVAGLMVSVFAFGLTASAATPPASGTPDPRDRINIWEGHWKEVSESEHPLQPRRFGGVPSDLRWTAERGYVVCQYLSEKVDARKSKPSDHLRL
jgi:hypothetical protein